MSNYQARLAEATAEEVRSQLEGSEGLFAVTVDEILYLDRSGVQRAALPEVKRVTSGKGGMLLVMSETATLIEAPLHGFQLGELKAFFKLVHDHLVKTRRETRADIQDIISQTPSAQADEQGEELPLSTTAPGPTPTYPPEADKAPAFPQAVRKPTGPATLLLKVLAVGSLAVVITWTTTHPDAALWTLAGLGGLGFAAIERRVSDLS